MSGRVKVLGAILAIVGIGFVAAGGYMFYRANEGADSLKAFSAAQAVEITYNEQGQLVDRGETAANSCRNYLAIMLHDEGAHRFAHLLCHQRGLLDGRVWQQNRKLLAAISSYGILAPHRASQRTANRCKNRVAGRMAVFIVQRLEMVYVCKE